MRFVCDSCRAQYMISDEKVGAKGVKVRCKKCGYVILVRRPEASAKPAADEDKSSAATQPPAHSADALLKGVEDDEIGAVFDQVLSSVSGGGASAPKSEGGDDEDMDATRVMDIATLQKLTLGDEANEQPAAAFAAPATNGAAQHEWFVAIDEKQVGPLSLEKVKDHWDRGEVGPDSLCWRSGFSDWMPLSEVQDLASVLAPHPQKPVISAPVATISAASTAVPSAFAAGAATGKGGAEVPVLSQEPATEMDISWKPSAASALASLVQDEMAALAKPVAPVKTNGMNPQAAEAAVVSSLLDVPSGQGGPVPNMPPASDRLPGAASAGSSNGGGYQTMPPYVPSYPVPVPMPQKGRGTLIAVIGGVGTLLVLLLGAVVYLLYQSTSSHNGGGTLVTAVQPTKETAPPAPKETSPSKETPGVVVASVKPPETAPAVREPRSPSPAPSLTVPPPERPNITVPGREPRTRRHHGGGDETAVRSSGPGAAPVDEPGSSDDAFEKEFGGPKGTPAAPKPPTTRKPAVYVPPPPGGGGDVQETLGKSDIMQVVVSHKPSIVTCVSEQKKRDPSTSGRLVIRWTVLTSGKTANVSVQSDEFKSSYLAGCLAGQVKSWTFPKHKVQGEPIDFPFTF